MHQRLSRPQYGSPVEPVDDFTLAEPSFRPNWHEIEQQKPLWRPLNELHTFSLKISLDGEPLGGAYLKRSQKAI